MKAPPAVAWRVFTEKMGTWWPLATHKIGKATAVDAVIEPRVGGRWYERGDDGSTCDWGRVLAWEPHCAAGALVGDQRRLAARPESEDGGGDPLHRARGRTGRAWSWSTGTSSATGHAANRCAASSTAKAAGVACSRRLRALLRRRERSNGMSEITKARKAVVARILEGDGRASHAQRRAAFDNAGLAGPLSTLVDKVAKHAYKVTDEDIAAARASGLSEDQIFELAVCAAHRPGHPAIRHRARGARRRDGRNRRCVSRSSITATVSARRSCSRSCARSRACRSPMRSS